MSKKHYADVVYRVHQPNGTAIIMDRYRRELTIGEIQAAAYIGATKIVETTVKEYNNFFPRRELDRTLMYIKRRYIPDTQSELFTLAVPSLFVQKEPRVLNLVCRTKQEVARTFRDIDKNGEVWDSGETILDYANTGELPLGLLTIVSTTDTGNGFIVHIPNGYFEVQKRYMDEYANMQFFELNGERSTETGIQILPVDYSFKYTNKLIDNLDYQVEEGILRY